MATVYYGDLHGTTDGNWNTVGNWFTTLGSAPSGCCCGSSGTPYGKVPQAGDSVIIVGGNETTKDITTGPTGGWAGPITWQSYSSMPPSINTPTATYSGTVMLQSLLNNPSSAPYTFGIKGGIFTGLVQLKNSGSGSSNLPIPSISGGTFYNVTRDVPTVNAVSGLIRTNLLSGGTYAPTGTLALSGSTLTGTLPTDPGFALGGGTFSLANVTVTGGGSVASFPRLDTPVYIQSVNDAAVLSGLQRGGAMRLTR